MEMSDHLSACCVDESWDRQLEPERLITHLDLYLRGALQQRGVGCYECRRSADEEQSRLGGWSWASGEVRALAPYSIC